MADILTKIEAYKREEIAAAKRARSFAAVEAEARSVAPPRGFIRAIERWEAWMFFAAEYAWALHHAQAEARRVFAEHGPPGAPKPAEPDGSNAWAVAPARTKRRHSSFP